MPPPSPPPPSHQSLFSILCLFSFPSLWNIFMKAKIPPVPTPSAFISAFIFLGFEMLAPTWTAAVKVGKIITMTIRNHDMHFKVRMAFALWDRTLFWVKKGNVFIITTYLFQYTSILGCVSLPGSVCCNAFDWCCTLWACWAMVGGPYLSGEVTINQMDCFVLDGIVCYCDSTHLSRFRIFYNTSELFFTGIGFDS